MPYVKIEITDEGVTREQKAELIRRATEMLVDVLGKNPKTTVVTIDVIPTDSWGVGGVPVDVLRNR